MYLRGQAQGNLLGIDITGPFNESKLNRLYLTDGSRIEFKGSIAT